MSRASRLLSGHQLRRLLAYGGLLVPRQGIWHAYRGADTRTQSAGLASRHVVARLEAAGYLQPVTDFPDRRTASDSLPRQRTARAVRRPADISVPCSRKVGAALDHLLEAMPDRGTRIRLKAAAGRFRDDSGQAVRPLRLYQPARTAKDAAMRMQGFECTLGTDVMESLEDLIIDRCGFAALCVRWRCGEAEAGRLARAALLRLAAAYDLSPAAESPVRASERIRSSIAASPFDR